MPRSRTAAPWILGLVAVLLAAWGVVWVIGQGGDAIDPGAAPIADSRGPTPEPELPDASGRRPEPPPTPPEAGRVGSVSGRLLTPDRRPVSAARIRAYTGTRTGLPGLGMQTPLGREGSSDDAGRFLITVLPETEDLLLQSTGDSFAVTESGPFRVVAGTETDIGDVLVDPGMTIAGSVVDDAGKAVPGAAVRFYQMPANAMFDEPHDFETRSDERGLFRFPYVRISEFTLRVTAEGFANARVLGFVRPDESVTEWPVKVQLRRVSPLRGTVLAKDGLTPIEGAVVDAVPLDPENDGGRAVTDADGAFEIDGIAAGNYVVAAVAEGYAKRSERTWADSYSQPIQLVLPPQGTLSGVVVGDDGRPLRHFELQARYHRRRLDPPTPRFGVKRIASEDGSFTVKNLDAGYWCVQVWSQGFALTESACVKVPQGRDVAGLVVQTKRGATLVGRVEDRTGAPVPGARVSLHTNHEPDVAFLRDTDPDPTLPPAVTSRADGTWRFTGLAERPYQLEVDHPDYALVRLNDVQARAGKESDVEPVVLERGGSISGMALTPGGQPVPGVAVYLSSFKDGTGGGETTTDGKGRFTFKRLLPGEYQLVCYGRNPNLGTMLSAAVGDDKPTPFLLQRAEQLTMNVVVLD